MDFSKDLFDEEIFKYFHNLKDRNRDWENPYRKYHIPTYKEAIQEEFGDSRTLEDLKQIYHFMCHYMHYLAAPPHRGSEYAEQDKYRQKVLQQIRKFDPDFR
jgi:hypothetical protein